MSKRKTHEEFIEELFNVNPNITIISNYVHAHSKVNYICNICGYIHSATPAHLLNGRGCPKCAIKRVSQSLTKSHEQFISEMQKINKNVEIIGKYITQNTKIKSKCLICGYEWDANPSNLLKGEGCFNCFGNHQKTTLEFIEEMVKLNSDIEILGEYINNATKIHCRCKKCNIEWDVTPAHLISGNGCPYCKNSKGEMKIINYLKHHNVDYIFQKRFEDCRDIRPLPFDFYIPSYNICIEYDGEQHFMPVRFKGVSEEDSILRFETQKQRDLIKNKYCQDNKIILYRISYKNFDKIEEILNNIFLRTTTE